MASRATARTGRQRLVTVILAVATLLLATLGASSVRFAQRQAEWAQWLTHTHEVIEQLQGIVSGVAESESALRGYGISHEQSFADAIDPAVFRTRAAVRRARELMHDNQEQLNRLDELEPLVEARLKLVLERAAAYRGGAPVDVLPRARELSQLIIQSVWSMLQTEQELLEARETETRDATALAVRSAVAATAFAVMLMVLTLVLLNRELRARQQVESHMQLLLRLGDLLQSCRSLEEAFEVSQKFLPRFFPESSGALALIHASRNLVDTKAHWGTKTLSPPSFPVDACLALRRGQTYLIEDGDVTCSHLPPALGGPTVCVPLAAHGELIGVLFVSDDDLSNQRMQQQIEAVAEQLSMALGNLQLRESLRNQSIRDPLTGLYNRRYAEETLQREISGAERAKTNLAVLVIDVDHFKRVNDTFGHGAGDYVLKELAELLRSKTRGHDVTSRMGGEELMIILPGANLEGARTKAEALRAAVASLHLVHQRQTISPVTISLGVAVYPVHATASEDLIRVADAALYDAKHAGRDRVCEPKLS